MKLGELDMSMFRRLLLIALTALPIAPVIASRAIAQSCEDPRKIIGGVPAEIKDHPWQVVLDVPGSDGRSSLCGGSLIQDKWVVTAAHCFNGFKGSGTGVKAGETNRLSGVWGETDRVIVHEAYDDATHENDVALVRLKAAGAGDIIPIARPTQELKPCEFLEVTGWGRTADGGPASDILQKAEVPYVENPTCNASNAYDGAVKTGMMCAGFREGGIDACQGDSGGPLVLRGPDGPVLVGIVSWGAGCAKKLKYGVYTRLSKYNEWVTKTILANQN